MFAAAVGSTLLRHRATIPCSFRTRFDVVADINGADAHGRFPADGADSPQESKLTRSLRQSCRKSQTTSMADKDLWMVPFESPSMNDPARLMAENQD
jgi:hypothetical protein